MPRQTWVYWTLFLLLIALKLPPVSSSRTLTGTGMLRQPKLLAIKERPAAALQAISSRHDGSSGSTSELASARSSSSSSSSSSNTRRALQALECSLQCAPDSCRMRNGGVACYVCNSGFFTTQDGGCGCRAGRRPADSAGHVVCGLCPAGSWCPGGTDTAGSGVNSCGNGLTSKRGAATAAQCVNGPGYSYNAATASAVLCGINTFSTGFGWQSSCSPCPGGFQTSPGNPGPYTSADDCRLKPGYYLRSWEPAVCNKGSWNSGNNRVATCTPCAVNVTTASYGSASAADCKYLAPGYEALSIAASGEITAVRLCRLNAYCPGDVLAPGWVRCPRGMWTSSNGRAAPNECLVPPGYYLPDNGGDITKCATGGNGTYKSGWGSAASCTPCGPGIYSAAQTNVSVYDPNTDATTQDQVATNSTSCFVYPGMGMAYQLRSPGAGYQFVGVTCNRNDSVNQQSTFGYANYTWGPQVKPCRRCVGVPIGPGPQGGATACAIPAGYAAVSFQDAILYTTGSSFVWARVKSVTQCPAGYYCAGGDPVADPAAKPVACSGATYSSVGATTCSSCPANAAATSGNTACECSYGFQAAAGTSSASGNLSCEACTGNTYTASGTSTCTACPPNTTALSDHTGCACNSGCSGTWPDTCTNCVQ